jgi:hypothetical protein
MSSVPPPEALAVRLMLARLRAEVETRLAAAVAPATPQPSADPAASVPAVPEGAPQPGGVPQRAAAGALARALQGTGVAPPAVAPDEAQGASTATLSDVARTVARLSLPPLADAERGAALERIVLTQLGAPADALAGELRSSLQRSGIFYEAHLSAWDAGRYPLAELRREPQARLGEAIAAARPEAPPGVAADSAARSADSSVLPAAAIPKPLEPVVREQLATLESRTAVVPLVLWPGQSATLAVAEDPEPEAERAAASGARAWRARLRLELPRLGEIEFSLALHGEQVSVGARAHAAASRAELAQHAAELRAALARNALALERIEVSGDER